jgi:NADPH2:quinone reductase
MKAIRVYEPGEPSVMKLEDVQDPAGTAGQAIVRIRAVGVNPVDTYIRAGRYPVSMGYPYTPGSDATGEIEWVDPEINSWQVGDRVFLDGIPSGAYAEKIVCGVNNLKPLPAATSFAQGAALGVPYGTAYAALISRAKAQPGDVVLIHGASGGVGLAAVQIAKAMGIKVLGTAGTPEGLRLVEEQGVDAVFNHHDPDYRQEIWGYNCGRGPDVILEMLANINLANDLQLLAPKGRVVIIGSRGEITINPRDAMSKDLSIIGMQLRNASPEEAAEFHEFLAKGLDAGALNPVIRVELPLAEAPHAHEMVMESGALGKIVLVP